MRTHVVINNTDMTPYVVDGSYKIRTEDAYESWNDGNMVEHRVVVSTKVTGSFDIGCSEQSITLSDLLDAISAATDNKVLTIGLYVPTLNQFKALHVYYELENTEHIRRADGSFIDVITITIKER